MFFAFFPFSSKGAVNSVLSLFIFASIVLLYFRMFSRNIYKRAAENEKYLRIISKIKFNKNSVKKPESRENIINFSSVPAAVRKSVFPRDTAKSKSAVLNATINL